MSKSKAPANITETARYRVAMLRPVTLGLMTYRPDAEHIMTGAALLAVLAAADAPAEDVATFTPAGD